MRIVKSLLVSLFVSTLCLAAQPDRILSPLTGGQMVALKGQVHPKAQPQYDKGAVDPSFPLSYMTLFLQPTARQQAAVRQLAAQQQDPHSPNYHKWITPAQYADRFGMGDGDIAKITGWLQTQGFSIVRVANGRNWIAFSGTAAQVQSAFHTEIHQYEVDGEAHIANVSSPSVPAALAGIVGGIRGLHDFRPKPHVRQRSPLRANPSFFDSNLASGDVLAPGDIATIYDISPLLTAGFDGTGQKMVIAGQTDVYLADLNDFRTLLGLPSITGCTTSASNVITACSSSNFQYVLLGTDPGTPGAGDVSEADLDLEWSNAVARKAKIIYVNSPSTTSGGVFDSFYDAIDSNLAPVISLSYGLCEFFDNNLPADEVELTKANTLGITFLNSSGDAGAAECDRSVNSATNNLAVGGLAVSYPASSPEVTGVGGTSLAFPSGFSSTFWGTSNSATGGNALSYIPEGAWNDDVELAPLVSPPSTAMGIQESFAISSSGGGPSSCAMQTTDFSSCVSGFPKPSWQTVTITGQPSVRYSPDISLIGSPDFPGYILCTPQSETTGNGSSTSTCVSGITTAIESFNSIVGGTSVSTPAFAGIVVLLNQFLNGASSAGLGNINPKLYSMAKNTFDASAFHKVTTGTNVVYCEPGTPSGLPVAYQCPAAGSFGFNAATNDSATGYNLVTGLGSVDANVLATDWAASLVATTTTLAPPSTQAFEGANVTLTATVTPSSATGTVSFFNNGSATALGSATLTAGTATFSTTALPAGTNSIVATYTGIDASSTSSAVTVTETLPFSLSPTAATVSVVAGQPGANTINVTIAPGSGFTSSLSYTCTGLPALSSCTFSPNPTALTTVSLTLTTTAATAQARPPFGRRSGIFCAMLLPGFLGILLVGGTRKPSLRGARMLSLIALLAMSTLWMGACGNSSGGGGSNSNPGTPAGSSTITVTGSTTTTPAITGTTTFTLTVTK
jgi:subtilase family serine protease